MVPRGIGSGEDFFKVRIAVALLVEEAFFGRLLDR